MKTLEEFNNDKLEKHSELNSGKPVKNGIACPKCWDELYDTNPEMSLMSSPPQKRVHCDCGYKGLRYA